MDHNLLNLLAVNRLPGNDGYLKRSVYDFCRDTGDLHQALRYFSRKRSGRSRGPVPDADVLLQEAETDLKRLRYYRIGLRVLGDIDYPASLAEISDPPMLLFFRGNLETDDRPAVAIVGTRRPSNSAMRQAFSLGLEFGWSGYPVVSGLAFGIDRAAHEGALSSGGRTWAVLAGGLDRPSPKAHRALAGRILENGGCLVSEMPPGCFPVKYAFPRRNRILSGLCRGTIVVQAPSRSGALITADFALDQNRDLYVASAGLEGVLSDGSRELERQGALVVRSSSEVLADWGRYADIRRAHIRLAPETGEDLARMMELELSGRLHRFMGGWFESRSA